MASTAHNLWLPPRVVPDPNAGTSVVQNKKHDALVAWTQLRPCIIFLHTTAAFFGLSNEILEHACTHDLDHEELPTADEIGLCLHSGLMLTD